MSWLATVVSAFVVAGGGESLVPPRAEGMRAWVTDDAVYLTWRRGQEAGFAARFRDGHALRLGLGLGYDVQLADVTGDGVEDALVSEGLGGTAAAIRYRLLVGARSVYDDVVALDEGTVQARSGALVVTEGVFLDPRSDGLHCCYLLARVTEKRWNGTRLVTARTTFHQNRRRWPPGP